MATPVSINITGIDAIKSRLANLPQKLTTLIQAELRDGANAMAAEAKQRAPANDGILRGQIVAYQSDGLEWTYASNAEYSPFVEFGTRTQVDIPPGLEQYASEFQFPLPAGALTAKAAILAWCKAKGIPDEAAYAIYISIMVKGIKPHPFFFPAYERIKPIIINGITKILVEDAFK